MSELTIELDRLIQKAALDGALTQDAVAQFHAVFTKCDAQTDKIKELGESIVSIRKEADDLASQLSISQGLNKIAAEMEASIINREQKMTELELTAKNEKQRVEDHQNMFGLVFRNAVLRNSVLGQELVAIPGTPDAIDEYGNQKFGTGRPPETTGVPVKKEEEKTET